MRIGFWMTTALVLTVSFMSGCGPTGSAPADRESHAEAPNEHDHDHEEHTAATEKGGQDHSGWWCNEHGVPEAVCALCNSKIAAEFQKKGDWCEEHDRPESQCFKCHPELEAKFAAQYEAKYGKQPPTPEG